MKPIRFITATLLSVGLFFYAGCGGNKAKQESASEPKPEILTMSTQKMAVVYTKGDPNTAAGPAVSALYGTVYALSGELKKKGIDFPVGALRARWPDGFNGPKEQWTGIWGLSVPDTVDSIASVVPGTDIKIETWQYGTVAQILHLGPYSTEPATVQRLMDFISKSGYEIVGSHEEEYLTPPGAPEQKTIIRYPVRKK
jgi:hypothetical protein